MVFLRKITSALLMTGCVAALLMVNAAATDIPYNAVVDADSALVLDSVDFDADLVLKLESGDELVVLSETEDGLTEVAIEDGEEVYSGYVESETLTAAPLETASILADLAELKASNDAESDTLVLLGKGTEVEILGFHLGWYRVQYNGTTGYLTVDAIEGNVTTNTKLNLRAESNTNSEVLDTISPDTELVPVSSSDGWLEVSYEGQTGYINADYVKASEDRVVDNPTQTTGEALVEYGKQFLGNRYVWGGTSLTNGCDCSGYVMKLYEAFGVTLPHSSSGIRRYGTAVDEADIQIGDVVCYRGHVGIYAGNGQIINALNKRAGICYTDMHYSRIVTIRRLV